MRSPECREGFTAGVSAKSSCGSVRVEHGVGADGGAAHPAACSVPEPLSATLHATEPELAPQEGSVILHRYVGFETGTLVRRYKRFLGEVWAGDGTTDVPPKDGDDRRTGTATTSDAAVETIYVPNTGPMTGLLDTLPCAALLTRSDAVSRKHACTLEWVRPGATGAGPWVGVHSAKANSFARELLERRLLTGLPPYDTIRQGEGGKRAHVFLSRVDAPCAGGRFTCVPNRFAEPGRGAVAMSM